MNGVINLSLYPKVYIICLYKLISHMSDFFHINIENATISNSNFRQVLYTGRYCQVVVMSLKPGEEIGLEVHRQVDQFFRIESGQAKFIVNSSEYQLQAEDAAVVPAGAQHNIINSSPDQDLKLYTIYSPPNHPSGTTHATKADADAAEESEDH